MSEKNTFDSLSDELKAKLKECKTEEELNKILAEAGLDLDQDMLKAVVGGLGSDFTCLALQCKDRGGCSFVLGSASEMIAGEKCPKRGAIGQCLVDLPPMCPPNGSPSAIA